MPVYTFECPACGCERDHVVSFDERDAGLFECGRCAVAMRRQAVSAFALGKPSYQMQAVLGNGDHLKGHFGKDAKRRKRRGK